MASRFSEIESGLIHFHGESSIGKTILLTVAWSLFGPCWRELLPNWNTTPTGFEEQLDVCTDLPFVCDELTFQKDAPNASHNLKTAFYAITSNRKKGRSKRWAGSSAAAVRRGKTFVLSNGEDSLASTRNTESRKLGEQCRAIDVEVRPRAGVFRTLPDGKEFNDLVHTLEACCRANYGHAGRRFIKSLILDKDSWSSRAEAAIERFLAFAKVPETRVDKRFAVRFALAYAAGLQARRCGILKVSEKRIARSLRRIYRNSSRPSVNETSKADEVLAALRAGLSDKSGLTVWSSDSTSANATNAKILVREDPARGDTFMVSSEYFKVLCGSKEVWNSVVGQLRQASHLVAANRGLATRQISVNGTRRRFLCIKSSFLGDGNQ